MIILKEIRPESFEVFYDNGVYIGDINRECDLCYNFWPNLKGGFWSAGMLKLIYDKLEELNAPILKEYNDWCEQNPPSVQTEEWWE